VEIVLRIAATGRELWFLPECAMIHRIPPHRTTVPYMAALNRGLGVSQALADALVWPGSTAGWLRAASLKLMRDGRTLGPLLFSVARGKASAADLRIQASFRFGQLLGIARIGAMLPRQRKALMGLARPRQSEKDRAA
jgi:hypothetical protein